MTVYRADEKMGSTKGESTLRILVKVVFLNYLQSVAIILGHGIILSLYSEEACNY